MLTLTSAVVKGPEGKFHCTMMSVAYPYIRTPLFILQNSYDSNQIESEVRICRLYGIGWGRRETEWKLSRIWTKTGRD